MKRATAVTSASLQQLMSTIPECARVASQCVICLTPVPLVQRFSAQTLSLSVQWPLGTFSVAINGASAVEVYQIGNESACQFVGRLQRR